ncbi:isoprenylcysteine carboxylmethyltransferase family protein [Phenylobacterium sp.]|uniref:methyltransferase family protein n=1 Tax=Phenylobacterium sp. TaxID=1871053 RepID=UPI002BA0A98E|nr:isoprenylcysteine carboxylmethyltransferase family protein [Phenylobacterium sp.]HLZ75597.1 isoprenylcysteine carboxylmethyltransferase family protein [Phenylobacterium sp.]
MPLFLVGLMMAVEAYAGRRTRTAAERRDNGTLYVIYVLQIAAFATAFWLWGAGHAPPPRLGVWALWAAPAVAILGAGLRVWAVHTLGQYFTYVVHVSPDQKVVQTGPYRWLRHPSYTGGTLEGVGIGLAMGYGLAPAIVGGGMLASYLIRIAVEEKALADGIGEPYRAYMARTKRLIPFVW